MRRVAIFGATSAIAEATARLFAAEGASLFLVARNPDKLHAVAADLRLRGAARVACAIADLAAFDPHAGLAAFDRHAGLAAEASAALDGLDGALIAYGTLGDQAESERDAQAMQRQLATNFLSAVSLLQSLAAVMGEGTIAAIGSVAGDRGRQSNYVYGAAKGGLRVFAQGLRHRLAGRGVAVVLIEPGFVDTPMTAGIAKGGALGRALWAKPERVARDIHRAMRTGGPAILYTPWFWRWIMLAVRLLPDAVFNRTRL